ncbi:Heterokaryon incompatibility protein 6 OR allele [Lachnellula suecica]|uniref:Heterokaryon incompatibility protein 6 OR allele n=1 Tax=Lachnellula suecica TaxID=602035 RepID=A0A8T9C8S3_9HELO|nr:Heterokaryon incompatibility protein 6 OR allele [Lachnellula suecica]
MASPRYRYSRLLPEYIRVLELHPGTFNAPLACNILTQQIEGQPYEALSYVWGDPTPVALVRCIDEINEGELGVGKGLANALFAFRLTDRARCIWIDALCINQEDVFERQSQVRLMGTIYSTAERVLCWLGPFDNQNENAESRARLAVSFLRSFNSKPTESLLEVRQHLHSGKDEEKVDGPLLKSWLAIKELFNVEYFHRAWIIQEIGLARTARLFWGTQDVWLDWTEVATFCNFMDTQGASVVNNLQLKTWVVNHVNQVWSLDPNHSFVEILHMGRVHNSTDPRDHIYALLSHPRAKMNGSLVVQPNYSITPAEAYVELALKVIEQTQSLEILGFVEHDEKPGILALPSWVPDWHALNLVAPLRYPTQSAPVTDNSLSIVDSGDGMILKCRGMVIDTVRATSDIIYPSELIITTHENELQKKTPFLIDHIWKKLVIEPEVPLASLRDFITPLSNVLTGGYSNYFDSTSGEHQKLQQCHFAAFVLEYERIRLNGASSTFFASLSRDERTVVQAMAIKGTASQFVQDMTWRSMCRKVFRTVDGHFGLGPRTMKEGDICVTILGAVYPIVMRRREDCFELVGPSLLHGFMNGEAGKLCQDNLLTEQEFQII